MTAARNSASRHRLTDEQLEMLIADSIGTHPMLWGAMITIEAHDGIVILTGAVRTLSNRALADLLARSQGALGVVNRLQITADGSIYDAVRDISFH
jgi:osmotically-inducible protein OsmY